MRQALWTATLAALGVSLLWAGAAKAAPPTLGSVSATNIQGVSALLVGTVDPEGLPTTYRYEYSTEADFAGSSLTPSTTAGQSTSAVPARTAIFGLEPATTYHYRLLATNSSGQSTGTVASFVTTAGFGFLPGPDGFSATVYADGGEAATQAASHPYSLELTIGLNEGGEFEGQPGLAFPDGDMRDLRLELPAGLLLNPSVLATCGEEQFHTPRSFPIDEGTRSGESCPDKSQVGTVEVRTTQGGGERRRFGLFNLAPAPGAAAQLGFAPYGRHVVLDAVLLRQPDASYPFSLEVEGFPQALDLSGMEIALWGIPWAASHDGERGNCLNEAEPSFPWAKCSVGEPAQNKPQAFLTMPARCTPALAFSATASSWQQPQEISREAQSLDSFGGPAPIQGCTSVPYDPEAVGLLNTAKASSGSGYNFRLSADHEGLTERDLRAPAPTRQLLVRLPRGVTVNPSVGAGLLACNPAQYAAESATSLEGQACPNGAKIGTFRVTSPLFDEDFEGAVYLATPDDPTTAAPGQENPFDSLVAVYLIARHPERGALVKLAGQIATDPASGDIVATFTDLPQLPYTDLDLTFRAGQRAFLISPPACGQARSEIELTPWSSPVSETTISSSQITSGIDNGPCPAGTPLFAPGAVTGGVNSNVNSYTPYFVRLTRKDTEQEITSYSLILPKGITGKLAGIPFCGEAAIAAARSRRGAAETASPSCPAASQVGRTLTGYGVGAALTYAPGRIYLAGPYNGEPLSLVTINSATVGPFDLGTIAIRSAFSVNPRTAQLQIDSAASDPIPHIIAGIPLHLREVRVHMDRPEFTHNPSSCEPAQMTSTLTGSGVRFDDKADDTSASVSRHFQLLNCLELGFRPKLGLRLRGGSRRGAYPSLRATFAARGPQDSNLKRIEVTMPHSLFLAQNHIRTVCTRAQFEAERCPEGSEYGKAVAYTPLFDTPLRGPVYLRSSTTRLPDLVASLRSGEVRIVVEGKIGPGKGGGIRAFFDELPDAPIERFTMTLAGGKRGLLTNSADICNNPPRATVSALGQNNLGARFTSTLRGQCKKQGKGSKGKGGRSR